MLSWTAASVRGFDLWQPSRAECPVWPGVAELHYGHDLCADPLPQADAAVMFEALEHLVDAPKALEIVFTAVPVVICSFPNPDFHGSSHNKYHVNDWELSRLQAEVMAAARRAGRERVRFTHFHQRPGSPLMRSGRASYGAYWIIVADCAEIPIVLPDVRTNAVRVLRQRLRLRSRLGLR